MKHELEPSKPGTISRRSALMCALKNTVAVAFMAPAIAQAAPLTPVRQPAPEFVPENDYPFFGGTLPDGY